MWCICGAQERMVPKKMEEQERNTLVQKMMEAEFEGRIEGLMAKEAAKTLGASEKEIWEAIETASQASEELWEVGSTEMNEEGLRELEEDGRKAKELADKYNMITEGPDGEKYVNVAGTYYISEEGEIFSAQEFIDEARASACIVSNVDQMEAADQRARSVRVPMEEVDRWQ